MAKEMLLREAKQLSADNKTRLELAKKTYNLVVELHPSGSYAADLRNTMFLALTDQVQEHFGAIILLVERRQFFGSAFALLRPLIETCLRAEWVQSIALEEELTTISQGKRDFPALLLVEMRLKSITH